MDQISRKLVFASFFILSISLFTSVSISAIHHIILLLPALWFAFQAIKNKKIFLSYNHLFLLCLIVFSIISVLFNLEIIEKPLRNIFKIKYLLIAFLGVYAVKEVFRKEMLTTSKTKLLVNILLISTTLATISGLIGVYFGYNPLKMKEINHFRASGMFGMVMSYAYGVSILLVGIFTALVHRKKVYPYVTPWILWSAAIINFAGLYLSYTRGAFVSFIVSMPFIFFYKSKKIFAGLLPLSLILLVLIAIIVATKTKVDIYRFTGITSDAKRMSVYTTVYEMIKDHPWKGVGFRNVEPLCPSYKKEYNTKGKFCGHAHNNYLEFLAGTGIFGFISFTAFMFSWFFQILRRKDLIAILSLGMIFNFALSGLTQSTIIDSEVTFLVMALYMISQIHSKKKIGEL